MRKVGFIHSKKCDLHNLPGHPENAGRTTAIKQQIEITGLTKSLQIMEARAADLEQIVENHMPSYIERVKAAVARGEHYLDADTYLTSYSFEAALLSAGGAIMAVDAALAGKVDRAFCCLRPPGHHAEPDRALGFCLFNNIAIAARHALAEHNLERVAIVDFDVHHGNGTQTSFYENSQVFFCSLHQYPFYPGSGAASETGRGDGEGYTLNLPLAAGTVGLAAIELVEKKLTPQLELFEPQLILISAGFDAHGDDPLAQLKFVDNDYFQLTKLLADSANELCGGRIVSLLEGGYNLVALARSVCRHLQALIE